MSKDTGAQAGCTFCEPLNTKPSAAGMDRGNAKGDQKVPKKPVTSVPGGQKLK